MNLEKLRFPIGEWTSPETITSSDRDTWISKIQELPIKLREKVSAIDGGYDRTYRPDGWNISQLVNHLADSHMNALNRFKLVLTEESPEIKPYPEWLFAKLSDYSEEHIEDSLKILDGVHSKWTRLLKNMSESDLRKYYVHSEYKRNYCLDEACSLYAWHGEHHMAHIDLACAK